MSNIECENCGKESDVDEINICMGCGTEVCSNCLYFREEEFLCEGCYMSMLREEELV